MKLIRGFLGSIALATVAIGLAAPPLLNELLPSDMAMLAFCGAAAVIGMLVAVNVTAAGLFGEMPFWRLPDYPRSIFETRRMGLA